MVWNLEEEFQNLMARNGQPIPLKDGLANNYVRSIAIDAQGNKWFGT